MREFQNFCYSLRFPGVCSSFLKVPVGLPVVLDVDPVLCFECSEEVLVPGVVYVFYGVGSRGFDGFLKALQEFLRGFLEDMWFLTRS